MEQVTRKSNQVTASYLMKLAANGYCVYVDGTYRGLSQLAGLDSGKFYTKLWMDLSRIYVTSITV